jgi:hypothetical protein
MKNRLVKAAVIIIVTAGALWLSASALADEEVHFADPALESSVRANLGLEPDQAITHAAAESIVRLDAIYKTGPRITDLDGIEALANLEDLQLEGNRIGQLDHVASLVRLKVLNLRDNKNISDLSPLASLADLEDLNLRGNNIVDVGPLRSLSKLAKLGLRENKVVDIGALSSMPLLADLNLRKNKVTSIAPLANLKKLVERLYLSDNPVTEYYPVATYYERIEDKDFTLSVPKVDFSQHGGFFTEQFELALASSDPSLTVYYTLDGSEPDKGASSTMEYTSPVTLKSRAGDPNILSAIDTTSPYWAPPEGEVFKCSVVRARVYCGSGSWPSAVTTNSYFVDPHINSRYTLPVVSIASDTGNFFDYDKGIYVKGRIYDDNYDEHLIWWSRPANYLMEGDDWERPVHVELFEPGGRPGFSLDAGVRIHGAATRALCQKSLRIYFSSDYDRQKILDYDLFPGAERSNADEPLTEFKRIILRNSGNDWGNTMFRDALVQGLLDGTRLDRQAYRPSVVFLNGEYWGIHNMRERQDEWYLETRYGAPRGDFAILENNGTLDEGQATDEADYKSLLDYIATNGVKDQEHYEHVKTLMDVDDFIDYYFTNIYVGNLDWPQNNVKFWRYRTGSYDPDARYGLDGRWRWFLYDTDVSMGLYDPGNYKDNFLHRVLSTVSGKPPGWSTFLFRSLMTNEEFKNAFVQRSLYHLANTFDPKRVIDRIDQMSSTIEPMMTEHGARWAGPDMETWRRNVESMKVFAENRPAYMIRDLNTELGLNLPGKEYSVAATAGEGGSITPSGTSKVALGKSIRLVIEANEGRVIKDVVVDGKSVGTPSDYTFENVLSDHVLTATFSGISTWYIAEGSTAWGFDTRISIENPNGIDLNARVTFFKSDGTTTGLDVGLPKQSQTQVNPRDCIGSADFSTKVECIQGSSIAVDRTTTWDANGVPSCEGHSSMGVPSAAKNWYFPEGSSAWGFETWLLIQNPSPTTDANCTLTYMVEGQGPKQVTHVVHKASRASFDLARDIDQSDFSIKLSSDVPVIAERSTYRNRRREGQASTGATAPSTRFFLGEGTTAWGYTTYILLQNPDRHAARVDLTYLTPDGQVRNPVGPFVMSGNSRKTVRVDDYLPDSDFSTVITSDRPIVAERSMYWEEGLPAGEACHDSIGMALPSKTVCLPDGRAGDGTETWTLVANPNDTEVRVRVSYLTPSGKDNAVFVVAIPKRTRKSFSMADSGIEGRASVLVESLTGDKKIIVERAMYWNNRGAGTDTIGAVLD